jgi:hypothetical protein
MTHRCVESAERRPDMNITAPAVAPLVMAGFGIPEARPFLWVPVQWEYSWV